MLAYPKTMSISFWQILVILLVVLLIFGTSKLRNIGSDLGGAIKGFKKSINEEDGKEASAEKMEKKDAEEKPKP